MRIVWVKVGGLWPADRGGRLRSYHLISALSRRHEVTVVTTHGPGDDPEGLSRALPASARIISLPHRMAKQGSVGFALALMRSWLSPLPVDLWKTRIPALRREVRSLLEAREADLCVADFLAAASNIPSIGGVPVVLFQHNVEHVIWQRLARTESRWWRRALLELECRKVRRVEARACASAHLTLAVSPADRELLLRVAPGARVRDIPTGVDTAYFSADATPVAADQLVFTGTMDWYPNEDAIVHFVDAILPIIRREAPRVRLTVVGRNPSPSLRALASRAGVHVTGTVDDVRPFVRSASVYVVPLRIGGGTRLKIFEALAMGKAVVSTSVGAEGLPLVSGEHFLAADDPVAFAQSVLILLRNPEARERIGLAGRRLVEARYSWSEVARQFDSCLHEAVTERRAGSESVSDEREGHRDQVKGGVGQSCA